MTSDLYAIGPSPDSADVRRDVWALQSCRATESARGVVATAEPFEHFRQVDGGHCAVRSPHLSQTSTATRTINTLNKIMNNSFSSLITSDAQAGLALAGSLADQLQSQIDQASSKMERPGGMNYLLPGAVPKEIIASILFYAIAAANRGWKSEA